MSKPVSESLQQLIDSLKVREAQQKAEALARVGQQQNAPVNLPDQGISKLPERLMTWDEMQAKKGASK